VSPTIAYSLPSLPNLSHAAVVVPSRRLAGVLLEGTEADDVAVEGQRRVAPAEPVDPVGEQVHRRAAVAVGAGVALAPEQVHEAVAGEVGVQRDPQQPPLGVRVDGEIEHCALHGSVDDSLDLAAGLLEHERVARADERHRDRLGQARSSGPDPEFLVNHLRRLRLGAAGARQRNPHDERECRPLAVSHLKLLTWMDGGCCSELRC
jgi:hypothetical protein